MKQVIVVTGATTGVGMAAAYELAKAGHTVYACLNEARGRKQSDEHAVRMFAAEYGADLRSVKFNGRSPASAASIVERVVNECGRLDVIVHNTGRMAFGPAEAFTPEQLAQLYDTHVLSTQRLNRAALPVLREQGQGLLLWLGNREVRGGTPPYLGAYCAAKAAMDALALSYAGELARWNIETSIVLPAAFPLAPEHRPDLESPEDSARLKEYMLGPTAALDQQITRGMEWSALVGADTAQISRTIVAVVAMPFGTRPLRVSLDSEQDHVELANGIADRERAEMLRGMGLDDLLNPSRSIPLNVYS